MKDWHKLKPELFKKQPYYLPGCDTYPLPIAGNAPGARPKGEHGFHQDLT
jgi:hypothetical protein